MDLESIVSSMHHTWDTRFITRRMRASRLEGLSAELGRVEPTRVTADELGALDRLYVRLAGDRHAELYASSIERIQRLRRPYRQAGPHIARNIVEATGTRYTDRFSELRRYLGQDTFTYDDIALTIDSLDRNQYVQRRARRDAGFASELSSIRSDLVSALYTRAAPRQQTGYLGRFAAEAATAAAGLLGLFSIIPTGMYAMLT